MEDREGIIVFLTRIIKNANKDNIESAKESIEKFREYLSLASSCDDSTIRVITNIANNIEELVDINEKTGICDLKHFFDEPKTEIKPEKKENSVEIDKKIDVKNKEEKKENQTQYQEKHYDKYVQDLEKHRKIVYRGC